MRCKLDVIDVMDVLVMHGLLFLFIRMGELRLTLRYGTNRSFHKISLNLQTDFSIRTYTYGERTPVSTRNRCYPRKP